MDKMWDRVDKAWERVGSGNSYSSGTRSRSRTSTPYSSSSPGDASTYDSYYSPLGYDPTLPKLPPQGRISLRNNYDFILPSPQEYYQNLIGAQPRLYQACGKQNCSAYDLTFADSLVPNQARSVSDRLSRYQSQLEFITTMLESLDDKNKIESFDRTIKSMVERIVHHSLKSENKVYPVTTVEDLDGVEEYIESKKNVPTGDSAYSALDFKGNSKSVQEEWNRRQTALMEFDFEVGIEIGNPQLVRAKVLRRVELDGWFKNFWQAKGEFIDRYRLGERYILGSHRNTGPSWGEQERDKKIREEESALLEKYDFETEYKRHLDAFLEEEGKRYGQYFFFRDVLGIENTETHNELLGLTKDQKLKIIDEIQTKLREKINRLRNIAKEVASSRDVNFKDAADQRFFELLLTSYYEDFPDREFALVVRDFAVRPYQNMALDLFNRLVLRSGPQFQKLMQVLGRRDGFSPELRKVFNRVEDAGLATPYRKIDPPSGYEWEWMDPKPFVGTIAQSYRAGIKATYRYDKTAVIAHRALKAGIKNEISEEEQRLIRVAEAIDRDPLLRQADFPLIGPILDDIKVMALEELDLKKTAENQVLAKQIYESSVRVEGLKISFVVPHTYEARTTYSIPEPQALDSSWLEGEKFENFHRASPEKARVVAEQIATLWVSKAFATKSFFHSDLHQGNMKVLANSPNDIQVGFLDFGMSDSLTAEDRSILVKLGVELGVSRNPEFIADYIWQLSNRDKNLLSLSQFKAKFKTKITSHKNEGLDFWLRYALSVGVALKKNINSFSRGLTAIAQLLTAGESYLTVSQLIQRSITTSPISLISNGLRVLKDHAQSTQTYKKVHDLSCSALLLGPSRK